MRPAIIHKSAKDWRVPPNLDADPGHGTDVDWARVRSELDGLPGGGLYIAHEAVDRHAAGAGADRVALRHIDRRGQRHDFTYGHLSRSSSRFAIWALLIGYVATYLPYGVRPMASAFVQVHAHLEESSLVCGASYATTMRRIIVPLLVPGIVSAWILLATMFIRELTLSVVLSRPGTEVLAVQILKFADDGLWGKLSALGIIMILISTLLVVAANFVGGKLKPV